MVSADCETTLEIVPASLTGTSKLRPQLPPSWGRNRPSRETFWPRGHLGKRILRAGGWSGFRCRAERIRSPSIEVPDGEDKSRSEYRRTRRYRQYQAEHHECRFLQGTASEVTPN